MVFVKQLVLLIIFYSCHSLTFFADKSTNPACGSSLLSLPERHELNHMNITCPFCGAYHWLEEKISTSRSSHPVFTTCCQSGSVNLPLLPDPTPFLRGVLEGNDRLSIDFRESIRQYNMSLAFTSLGVKEDRLVNRRGGWVFRVSGELCHLIGLDKLATKWCLDVCIIYD